MTAGVLDRRPFPLTPAADLSTISRPGDMLGYRRDGRPIFLIGGGSAKTYIVYNSAMVTTAAPVKQPTGTAIRTMMQLAPATGFTIRPIAWGASFDASAAATPGEMELIDTGTVFATVSTAFAVADVQPYGDPNAPANTSGSSGVPLNLGTALSGFATASGTEGTPTATRMADPEQIAPTNQYVYNWPLSREFEVPPGHALRVRATFGATVNLVTYVLFEI